MAQQPIAGYRYCQEHDDWVIAREYNETAQMCMNCAQVAVVFKVEVDGKVFDVDRRKIPARKEDRSVSLPAYRAAMKRLKDAHPEQFRAFYLDEMKRIGAEREVLESLASVVRPDVDVLGRLSDTD